jgi:hypothetical protein
MPFLYSPKRTVHEVVRAVLTHDFMRLAVLASGATMLGSVPSWTRDLWKRRPVGGTEWERRDWRSPISMGIIARMMRDIAKLEDQ